MYRFRLLAVLLIAVVLLSGCAQKAARQEPSSPPVRASASAPEPFQPSPVPTAAPAPTTAPAPKPSSSFLAATEVDQMIARANALPFFIHTASSQYGFEPNGDCYGTDTFVHRGLQNWDWNGSEKKWTGPYWDTYLPQVPFTNLIEENCRTVVPGFAVLEQFRERFRQVDLTTWLAEATGTEKPAGLPGLERSVKTVTVTLRTFNGATVPSAIAVQYDGGSGKPPVTEKIRFEWGNARFPAVPAATGLGLAGLKLGSNRNTVEGPPHGRPYATHVKNPDGTEWAKDGVVEVKYDKQGIVVVIRKTGGKLLNGLLIGQHKRPDVESRFDKPASATEKELIYNYPGGYRLAFELSAAGTVTAVRAMAPGQ